MSNQVKDLSTCHQLISDLFKWPATKSGWDQYRLTNEQLDFFKEYGYLSNVKLVDEWQVEKLNEQLIEIARLALADLFS